MGEWYSQIVPEKVGKHELQQLADKALQYLTNKKIVFPTKTDCVLGEGSGYPPAENFRLVVQNPDEHLFGLKNNGLEINIGRRRVFHPSDVNEIKCPDCSTNIIDSDWGQALEEWVNQTGKDNKECPKCGTERSVTDFVFEPTWAFGELGFTFWNWGTEFEDNFIRDFEILLRHKVKVVYGKL